LPKDRSAELKIFDILGREIRAFSFSSGNVGLNVTYWDGKDRHGECVGSGIYFLLLKQGQDAIRRKFIVLR
ncbi:MAG: T9SS type A sorting domain-containing protein, partial [Candidatus Neomarinimicrobiota bacterium]